LGTHGGLGRSIPDYKAEQKQARFENVLDEALNDGCVLAHVKQSSGRVEETTYAKFQCDELIVEWGDMND